MINIDDYLNSKYLNNAGAFIVFLYILNHHLKTASDLSSNTRDLSMRLVPIDQDDLMKRTNISKRSMGRYIKHLIDSGVVGTYREPKKLFLYPI